ncbi:putative bifunctional diguanylate cyclase/phosphodiesterase [Vibrio genomosp. F10]|uniref:putative bifunctional diguanylate cyclase/phosphodiesterase n=1 Tax=Vibrio genomosp. F10 TaxID=723171 RepID=UPI0002F235D0|nr:EAL domain-containing protein [Vibrio genomosp. F10]OEF07826.1 diguanylate phosphodiesterase [Vibrio genomosp. F10 str. 9ZD137]OEF10248.1 diguanylate phosphodiesterase [Vibrio genomosp. F10 str. 9ZB36]
MKLNTRILLLVAPVIALSAALSSYSIFQQQKDALLKREESYLQLNMEKLAGYFRHSVSVLNGYSYTLTKSDIIRYYFHNENSPYHDLELIDNLKRSITSLQSGADGSGRLAILDNNRNARFYVDSNTDTLDTLDPKIREYTDNVYTKTKKTSHIGYTQNSQGEGVLIRYDLLGKDSLKHPTENGNEETFFVVVSVSLTAFNQLRKQIEFDTKSSIFFTEVPIVPKRLIPDPSKLTQTVQLKKNFYATLDPAHFIIDDKIYALGKNLASSFGISSLITVLILTFLLYRHVISPISRLDQQLGEVESNQRKNIELLKGDDEIAHLSRRFHAMYQELNTTYQKTKALAENDHLTQLANRHHFHQLAERALSNTRSSKQVWILYIDLDNFKYVNDKYGHTIGDKLLINFAHHIQTLSDEFHKKHHVKCFASRLSGDEFAIFISSKHFDNESHIIRTFTAKLLEPIQKSHDSLLGSFPVTASVGIATYPKDGNDIHSLISRADTAMYQAKKAGKNQVGYYSKEMDEAVQRRTQIERALRNAEIENEFRLVYQPYFDQSGANVVGVEALLRWHSLKLGMVCPSEFIPIAEQTGLFGKIDRWVIRTAFGDFGSLQSMFEKEIQLSINLSSAELDSLQLANYVQQQATLYNVNPNLIDFEITETFASDSQSFPLLHELTMQGYRLAIDDFGSGYTSITHLVQYPVQKIKLDRFFLETLIKTGNEKVIKPLIDLCHSQSMAVTAEGIENEEMHYWLSAYQCDYMQGFHFAHPLSLEELKIWRKNLQKGHKKHEREQQGCHSFA